MARTRYAGRSLGFIRVLLDCPPMWASAKAAADHFEQLNPTEPPNALRGYVVLFYDTHDHRGNVALWLGHNLALTCDADGDPWVTTYQTPELGTYRGYVTIDLFRAVCEAHRPVELQ